MISALAAEGKRIGVTAVSHKVITNLLERAASYSDTPLSIAQRTGSDSLPPSIRKIAKSTDVLCLLYTSPSPRDQRGARMPSSA